MKPVPPAADDAGEMPEVQAAWGWTEERLRQWQWRQLNRQLREILPANRFYTDKLGKSLELKTLDDLQDLPLTTKQELVEAAEASQGGLSRHHTYPREAYSRVHRTSGTSGHPLMIADTAADWRWWSVTWQHVLQAAGVTPVDRVFLAFSFGPFVGFWSAHQACVDRGATVVPGGGLSSLARLEFMRQTESTVVCCTPSYALHLAEIAEQEGFPLAEIPIRRLIVAGEAGGSLVPVRQRIEQYWQAQVVDHSGATEIGPWGFGYPDRCGLHVIETSFIAELIPLDQRHVDCYGQTVERLSATEIGESDLHELVLTSVGRLGAPVIRYRTGDVVQRVRRGGVGEPPDGLQPCNFLWLPDGVTGRADNMLTIRGVNVFPSSIDTVVREIPQIAEYRVRISRAGHLDQLALEIEGDETTSEALEKRLSVQVGLRVPVTTLTQGSLPRSQGGKVQRWIDDR